MKGRMIAVATPDDRPFAAALLVDGRLEDLVLAPKHGTTRLAPGQTVTARVTRKLPKSGAFCDVEGGGEGYLRDARAVEQGETVAAQVQSLPEPGKAVTLTLRRLEKGPRVILTPGAPGINVSKKIGNPAERDRLAASASRALGGAPEDLGAILRTSAKGASDATLAREIAALEAGAASDPLAAAVREWLCPAPDIFLAPAGLAKGWLAEPAGLFGDEAAIGALHAENDAFAAAGVWEALDALTRVETAIGDGRASFEATRALVAVDVDTGGDFSPAAGLKTNIGVARDLPRQLRLRGLGGKVLVDFAPMPKSQRRQVEEALGKAFRTDPIETSLVGWTTLGLFEIQRKRERWPLMELL